MSEPLGRVLAGFSVVIDPTTGDYRFYAATDDGLVWRWAEQFDEDDDHWEPMLLPVPHTYAWQRMQGTFHG